MSEERVHELLYSCDSRTELCEMIARLEDKNAKLQELCEDMLDCIEIRAAFGRPPTDEMYKRFADAARELGMEVGNGVEAQV